MASWRASVVLFAGLAGPVSATAGAQVVRTSAASVEFLGLEKWTPAEIQQQLGYKSADQLHYCAQDLKAKLGFPEVAVLSSSEHGHRDVIITVVEPQRAGEIVYKRHPTEHISMPSTWETVKNATEEPRFLEGGILDYGRTLPAARMDRPWLSDGTVQAWWPKLRQHRGQHDLSFAQKTLARSDDPDARSLAAVILMNFADKDGAWRGLVSGLRDPDFRVEAACWQALSSLATYHPHKVDWTPATSDLIPLLHGTDLFSFESLLETLTATHIDPSLASQLLGNGGARLVLAY